MGDAPRRADARRNRERVLAAAQEAFAEAGLLVPLDEIARRAGVGAGTVYRHFATKEALFVEVATDRVEKIVEEARELANSDNPGPDFYNFLLKVVDRARFNHTVWQALEHEPKVCTIQAEHDFNEVLGELLRRAQAVGAVRADIETADLRALLTGCLVMERGHANPGRMTALVVDTLRSGVTKPERRNETCEICDAPLPQNTTGRPARFCSAACRQKAHRRRREVAG